MKTTIVTCALALSFFFLAGCDRASEKREQIEMLRLEECRAERIAKEKQIAVESLKAYIKGRCKLVFEDMEGVSNALAVVEGDVARLEEAVAAATVESKRGETAPPYEQQILNVLKDANVNALAKKYLASGFAAQKEAFVGRVREALNAQKAYRDAVAKSEAAFEEKVGHSKDWSKDTRERRQAEIQRLKKEIVDLEKKQVAVRKGLQGSRTMARENADKRREYEDEVWRKRRQLEALQNPDHVRYQEDRSANDQIWLRDKARGVMERELFEIDRRLKPRVSVVDIVREVEEQTLGSLRKAMQERKKSLSDRASELATQVKTVKELQLELLVCSATELNRLRQRLDKVCSQK